MTTQHKLRRLLRLIEAYGADPAHWPAGERRAAKELRDSSDEVAPQLAAAARLDAALAKVRAPRPSAALEERVRGLAGAANPVVPIATVAVAVEPKLVAVDRRMAALALAASLLLGLAVGLGVGTPAETPNGALAQWANGASGDEIRTVIGLVEEEPWPFDTPVALALY